MTLTVEPQSEPALTVEALPRNDVSYADVLLFIGFSLLALVGATVLTTIAFQGFEIAFGFKLYEEGPGKTLFALAIQLLWWVLTLAALYHVLVTRRGLPFGSSLGWISSGLPAWRLVSLGVLLAFGVAVASSVITLPEEKLPFEELFADPVSIAALAVFGILIAPPMEEIVFRGFLFRAVEHSHGALAAVGATSLVFSLLHAQQYGYHWQILLILFGVGAALGAIRATSGSSKASAIIHAAYNATLFAGFFLADEQALDQVAWIF